MALELNGTTGVSLVQDGVITDANLPAGSVLQVVQGTQETRVTTTTTGYIDTNLSASITPSSASSKILVIINQPCVVERDATFLNILGWRIRRDSTTILDLDNSNANIGPVYPSTSSGNLGFIMMSSNYLDSPASTSSLTYKTQIDLRVASASASVAANASYTLYNATSIITLMEIAGS